MIPLAWLLLVTGCVLVMTASGIAEFYVGIALCSVGMAGLMQHYRGGRN